MTITRIHRLEVENFQGLIGKREIDLDADIVLISGPNGFGKSSLLRALSTVLNGQQGERLEDAPPMGTNGTEEGLLRAWVTLDDEKKAFEIGFSAADKAPDPGKIPHLEDWLKRFPAPQDGTDWHPLSLFCRTTAFFQEGLLNQFDETPKGTTLRDLLEPPPAAIVSIRDALLEVEKALARKIDREKGDSAYEETKLQNAKAGLEIAWQAFRERLEAFPEEIGNCPLPSPASGPAAWAQAILDRELDLQNAEADLDDLARRWRDRLEAKRQELVREAVGQGDPEKRRGLEQEKMNLEGERDQIEKKFPDLDAELDWFEAGMEEGLPNPAKILKALSRYAEHWGRPLKGVPPDPRLREFYRQFSRVRREEARLVYMDAHAWWKERQDARQRLAEIKRRQEEIEDELKALSTFEALEHFDPWRKDLEESGWKGLREAWAESALWERRQRERPQRKQRNEVLKERKERIKEATEALDPENEEHIQRLTDTFNQLLRRFHLVDGIQDVKLEKGDKEEEKDENRRRVLFLKTKDGRELLQLSTGQKGQLAIALLVAQNLLLSHFLPHRVLLVDDLTTSYDLTNLAREAALWRQLAYGYDQDHDHYRQVILSSHHDALTQRLQGYLRPPEGRSLLILQLEGWDPEKGPVFRRQPLWSSRKADAKARESLAEALNQTLKTRETLHA